MSLPLIFFLLVGAISLAAAMGVVLSREPVHSALFLLANFATLAVLYVMLDAQFLAAAQIIVYAGGIVILILFVIMLIGGETTDFRAQQRTWGRYVGLILGLILLGSLGYGIVQRIEPVTPEAVAAVAGGTPVVLGLELFTKYILHFELVAILLLVALIGALVLGRQPGEDSQKAPRTTASSALPSQPAGLRESDRYPQSLETSRQREKQAS